MAQTKRTSFQIERDRHEIADLYVRRVPQWKVAEIINRRRRDEYHQSVNRMMNDLGEDDPIPEIMPPYELTRQMITYDLKAIQAQWRKDSTLQFDEYKARQLATIDKLEAYAWEVLERAQGLIETRERSEVDIELLGSIPRGASVHLPAKKIIQHKKIEQLLPDSRWGALIDRCLERREKLLKLTESLDNPSVTVQMTLDEWKKQRAERRAQAENALSANSESEVTE